VHPKTLFAALAIGLPALVLTPRLAAQDVTITPLEWLEPVGDGDRLPVETEPMQVKFPADLRNTPDPGYVIARIVVDEDGGSPAYSGCSGTLTAYEDAVYRGWRFWKHAPGYRHGKPATTYSWCAVIFNPGSAGLKQPDATPRLIKVHPVVDPTRASMPDGSLRPPDVVWVTLKIDADGKPTDVSDAPDELVGAIKESLRKWKFAPARKSGRAVAAVLRVPFVVTNTDNPISPEDEVLPRAISTTAPIYPESMLWNRMRGEVLLDVVINTEGSVTKAKVVRSVNPAFDEPALKAVQSWRFTPGRRFGRLVDTHIQVPMTFQVDGIREGGRTGMYVENEGDQSDLPPEYRYDVAPKLRARVTPVYPYPLLRDGAKGEATVGLIINEKGRVSYATVKKASRPEFGGATLAMLEAWEFEPALKDGRPTRSVFSFKQEFSPHDTEVVPDRETNMASLERKHPDRIVSAGNLDRHPVPTTTREPVFPVSLPNAVVTGRAVVEILIDKEGRVCLPRVVSASDPAFGWAAVQAVTFWSFEPPTMKGQPVITRVRIPFNFELTANPPAGTNEDHPPSR